MPWTQQDEAEALQASDLYLVSFSEWIERATQVTEEDYNQNPFAQLLNEQFGNPFERGLYTDEIEVEASENEQLVN